MAEHNEITLKEYRAWEELSFSWARSYDTKDWDLLRSILAPVLRMDYTEVYGHKDDNTPRETYVGMVSSVDMLGKRNIKTQHMLGIARVQKLSATQATAWRQIRAAHVTFDMDTKQEIAKSIGHGLLQFFYDLIDGKWKIAGLKADSGFFEGDIRSVFPTFPEVQLKF